MLRTSRGWFLLATLAGMLAGLPVPAASLLYTFEIPDGESITYEFDIDVPHAGPLSVEANWTGSRVLSLRLEPSRHGNALPLRRSGPSPQRLQATATPDRLGPSAWRFSIFALAASGTAQGRLEVRLPPPSDEAPARPQGLPEQPHAPPEAEDWSVSRVVPADLPPEWRQFLESIQALRSLVVDGQGAPDSCRWQIGMLRFLDEAGATLVDEGRYPDRPTRELLRRISEAVESVERARSSDDPLISGPPPPDPPRRQAWLRLRREKIRQLEAQLDGTLAALQREHAPTLARENWPLRLVSCVTACQRHFEERVRLGADDAGNRELAEAQWARILAAGQALERLVGLQHR